MEAASKAPKHVFGGDRMNIYNRQVVEIVCLIRK